MTAEFKWYKYKFGEAGNLAAIPDDTQGGGELSLQEGWGSDYELDPDTQVNAKFISRSQHNQLWQTATGNINFWQKNLYPLYTLAADNGGVAVVYAFGTRVRYDAGAGEKIYEVIDAAGTNQLPSVTADWVLVDSAYPRSGTAAGEQRTNTQNEALFQDTGDYRASADDSGMVARGFAIVDIPPLEQVKTSTTGSFVSYGSYGGAFVGDMCVDGENGDIFVCAELIIYKSIGGVGAFLAVGSYSGASSGGIAVNWKTKDVFVSDHVNDEVYRLPGGVGVFASYGSYGLVAGATAPSDISVDQKSNDVVVSDTSLGKLAILRGGVGVFSAMELSPPGNLLIEIDKDSNYFCAGNAGKIYRSFRGEAPYALVGTIPTGNAPNNLAVDHYNGLIYISDVINSIVYVMPVTGGTPVAAGSYPDTNLVSVAMDSGRGHVYAGGTSPSLSFNRLEGVIDSPAANWYIKT